MLSWLKRIFSNAQFPPELQRMLDITVQHSEHPLIKNHLRQVAIIGLHYPDGRYIPMFLPEFRDGLFAALIWDDVEGIWGSGGWIPVAHENADVTCEPTYLNWDYLTNTPGFDSPKEVMDYLYQTRPSGQTAKE